MTTTIAARPITGLVGLPDGETLHLTPYMRSRFHALLQERQSECRLSRDHLDLRSAPIIPYSGNMGTLALDAAPSPHFQDRPSSKKRLQRQLSQSRSVSSPSTKVRLLSKPRSSTTSDFTDKPSPVPRQDDAVQFRRLSCFDQTAPRGHVRQIFCFPLQDGEQSATRAVEHLEASLHSLAKAQPEFAGALVAKSNGPHSSSIYLRLTPSDTIPLVLDHAHASFGYTYDELRAQHFPPQAFVGPRFAIESAIVEGGKPIPAAVIKAIVIEGGLLLMTYLHHTLADGDSMRLFLDYLSAHSRGEARSGHLRLELDEHHPRVQALMEQQSAEQLMDSCAEYVPLPTLAGPTQPIIYPGGSELREIEKSGKIFRFSEHKMQELKARLAQSPAFVEQDGGASPSTYTALSGLTWAHVARARLSAEDYASEIKLQDTQARLMNPVNWKKRALRGTTDDYFGNATVLSFTRVSTSRLWAACRSRDALGWLVKQIQQQIDGVDDEFVYRRQALYQKISDARSLGLDLDPRTPQDLGFNTWRFFGGDTAWKIPGTARSTPEVVRRGQDAFNMGGALILPAAASSSVHELLVTLPAASMDRLLQDSAFMQWVEQVVG